MAARQRSSSAELLADSSGQSEDKDQYFSYRLVKLCGNLVSDLDVGQRAGQHLVFLDRDVVGLGDLNNLGADAALALGGDPRRPCSVVMQRDRKLLSALPAHSARSRKCPAGAEAVCTGA